jgi:hypothetical protein
MRNMSNGMIIELYIKFLMISFMIKTSLDLLDFVNYLLYKLHI